MAAADIGRFPSRSADAAAGAGPSGMPGDTAEVGTAPNGERLYQADWYRRPRSAELSTYLPPGAPRVGWGLIACQTVPDYRVDNCQELGQSPPGSGLARAVRQAAWQFRVRPPRIGGKPLIGAWVRIRIEYGEAAEE
jgi:protein TonB